MVKFHPRISIFSFGLILGLYLGSRYSREDTKTETFTSSLPTYDSWFSKKGLRRKSIKLDTLRYSGKTFQLESNVLSSLIKVHCIILQRIPKNVEAAKNTWASGCNELHVVQIPERNGPGVVKRSKETSSWVLLCETLKSILSGSHWYLVINDDTFVILENLRYFVAALNHRDTYYLGYAVQFWNTVYNSGQAGYVLSLGTVQALKRILTDCTMNNYWNREDFYLGKYLANLNITPTDTRDWEGLSTFFPYNWYQVLSPRENYYKTSVFPMECCSKHPITFQAVEGDKMYTYYYLLYKLGVFVDGKFGNKIPSQVADDQVWKKFLKERNIDGSRNVTAEEYYKLWEDLIDDPNSFAVNMKRESFR